MVDMNTISINLEVGVFTEVFAYILVRNCMINRHNYNQYFNIRYMTKLL